MSAALKYICPVCHDERREASQVREHCATKEDDLHKLAATLPDIAFENPAFGEKKFGAYTWSDRSPQGRALAPLWKAMATAGERI